MNQGPQVDIRPLKQRARLLQAGSAFRVAVLAEDDILDAEEYCYKVKTWLKMLEEPINGGV